MERLLVGCCVSGFGNIPEVQSVEAAVCCFLWCGLLNPLVDWHYYVKACFIKGRCVRRDSIAFSCLVTQLCPLNSGLQLPPWVARPGRVKGLTWASVQFILQFWLFLMSTWELGAEMSLRKAEHGCHVHQHWQEPQKQELRRAPPSGFHYSCHCELRQMSW